MFKLNKKQQYKRADEVLRFMRTYCSSYEYTSLYELYFLLLQYKKENKNKCEKKFQEITDAFTRLKFSDDKKILLID